MGDSIVQSIDILTAEETYGRNYLEEFRRIVDTYARTATRFLEWGSGHTTLELVQILGTRGGCELFVTIDDYRPYLRELLSRLPSTPVWLDAILESLEGPMTSQIDPQPAYSTRPLMYGAPFDFV